MKLLSPTRRREAVIHVRETLTVSERQACRVLGQVRRTQRYAFTEPDEETVLVAHVVSLAPFRVLSHRDGIVDFDDFPPTASLM